MAIIDIYSKRQKRLRGEMPDIYVYNDLSNRLRVQIIHLINDTIGIEHYGSNRTQADEVYAYIHETFCREYGTFYLGSSSDKTVRTQIFNLIQDTVDVEKVIDVVEFTFNYIDVCIREEEDYPNCVDVKLTPDEAIADLNQRFKEAGVGYSFEGGEIIRIDSTYLHENVTKPTINLLSNTEFSGANEEYLKAHEHYRHGRNKECLTECLKAFESTMKTICTVKGWTFNQTDPAKKLIQVCFQNQLVPTFTQNQFTSLQSLLESGIPTIRNKLGGHGQGPTPQKVDDEMTRYGLNLTGTTIIFLIEQSEI